MNPAVGPVISIFRVPSRLAVLALLVAFSGCGTGADSKQDDLTQKQLLATDLQELSAYKNSGAIEFDRQTGGIFTRIFGGTTGGDLTQYLNLRVHYYLDANEDVSVTPSDFAVEGWTEEMRMKTFSNSDQDVTTSAVNISIEYWILGLINNVTVTFNFQDQTVPIASSRTGIVLLDKGYTDTIQIKDEEGNEHSISMPSFYRQSILLHEARHSDCTGGLTKHQLSAIGRDTSAAEFSQDQDAGTCGHLHVQCPSGDYKGLYACDAETYGAYGVQDVFLEATDIQLDLDGEDHSLADAMEIDVHSRLLKTDDQAPDMSSSDGIIQ